MSSNVQQPMMFAAAPGDDAGLAYVREYVGAQLAVGRLPAEILASFGAAQADPGVTVDTAELCRMVLAHVHTVQEEQLPRALVAAAREGPRANPNPNPNPNPSPNPNPHPHPNPNPNPIREQLPEDAKRFDAVDGEF